MKRILALILLVVVASTICGCEKLDELVYPPLEEKDKEYFSSFLDYFVETTRKLDGDTLQRMYSQDAFMAEVALWLSNQPDLTAEQNKTFWATTIIAHMMNSENLTIEQLQKMTISINKETMRGRTSSFVLADAKIGFEDDPSKGTPVTITMQLVRDPIGGATRPAIFNISSLEE